jgi:hypothetical protein
MRPRSLLTAWLTLAGLALGGCGNPPPSPSVQAGHEPLSAASLEAAQAQLDQARDSERAYQAENLIGKAAASKGPL